jgi:hypothetical protein
MRSDWSAVWLEVIGAIMMVVGAMVSWGAWFVATHPPDPALTKVFTGLRIDLSGWNQNAARWLGMWGGVLAFSGGAIFFWAAYLVGAVRVILALMVVASIGVWIWLAV